MKALILDGKVVGISETEFEVHSSMSWVDCDDNVAVGWTYDGSTFTTNEVTVTAEEQLNKLRLRRNAKLAETDWTANSDVTMSAEMTTYRQALRGITDSATSLDDVTWPTKP